MKKHSAYSADHQASSSPDALETFSTGSIIATADCLSELVAEMLAAGRSVRLPVWGTSMLPSLRTSDVVEVRTARVAELHVGDVVVCRLLRAVMVVHRLIAKARIRGEWWLALWPEAGMRSDAPIPATSLLGRVVAVERQGRQVDFSRRVPLSLRCRARVNLLRISRPRLWSALRIVLRPACRVLSAALRALPKLAAWPLIGWFVRRRISNLYRDLQLHRVRSGPPPHDRDWQWLAVYRRRLIGTVSLSSAFGDQINLPSYWLVGLWVAPWYRRQGVKRRLIQGLIDFAPNHDVSQVFAAVRRNNPASTRLLSNCGFAPADDPDLQAKIDHWYERSASLPPGSMIVLHLDLSAQSAR